MPFINFAELKAAIPVDDAARALGLQLTPDGDGYRSPCRKQVLKNYEPQVRENFLVAFLASKLPDDPKLGPGEMKSHLEFPPIGQG
jgi:hypothetical protein